MPFEQYKITSKRKNGMGLFGRFFYREKSLFRIAFFDPKKSAEAKIIFCFSDCFDIRLVPVSFLFLY